VLESSNAGAYYYSTPGLIIESTMKRFRFKKIDAFATKDSDGNPAGYIHLDSLSDISTSEMQKIASELRGFVNEVGYIAQKSQNCFSLKYFSSEQEVAFCGHATVAIMHDMIKNNNALQQMNTIEIETNRGTLQVINRVTSEDAVFITAPKPFNKPVIVRASEIADVLGISQNVTVSKELISIINAGLSTLIVPIVSLEAILQIRPDFEELKTFCINSDIDIIEVYTKETSDIHNDYRVRVFAPKFGYLEDPATGSGNAAFGYHLINNGKFNKEVLSIEQNGFRNRFNIVKLLKNYNTEDNVKVLFGGGAIARIEGSYILQ
jgi:PhzF family phenazine biosynthesis protein